jgi:copper chaperone CopZ
MSRRDEEFRHRTSIFEGAFRAWSHLGCLDPALLETKSVKELDPIAFPATRSPHHRDYPYEPLPRSGLGHPFVKAVLGPWLGPDVDADAVELGLNTLRTWWQHRRKGESKTAQRALHTEHMATVVDKYTQHFFELAHCLVVSDNVQPPRSLHAKLKKMGKSRRGGNGADTESPSGQDSFDDLSPLERVHATQRAGNVNDNIMATIPVVNVRGKCIPGQIDLPGMVRNVSRISGLKAYHGAGGVVAAPNVVEEEYGDPETQPIVFYNGGDGDLTIVLQVGGITCAHCVKIVETVLKGCRGDKSPIEGLLDAAADRGLNAVLIKIESPAGAKRIAFEAARNLSLVGYTAKAREVKLTKKLDREGALRCFKRFANAYPCNFFNWSGRCSCPDNGVFRDDCDR